MRCTHCDAELARVQEGGVTGLALLPKLPVPYSHPNQRVGTSIVNGPELLFWRSQFIIEAAKRERLRWRVMQLVTGGAILACALLVFSGFRSFLSAPDSQIEACALQAMGGLCTLPLLGYVLFFLQGRSRLVTEHMQRALNPSISPTPPSQRR